MKRIVFLLTLAAVAMTSAAKVNDKYFNAATEKVWAMNLPQFDPLTPIPDSIARGNSAVVIAQYVDIDAKYEPTMRGSATTRSCVRRTMVKLLDQSAVSYFSDFEFDEGSKTKTMSYEYGFDRHAFGVKVHKPDGTVNVVDMTAAFELNSGKKAEKLTGYKIAVPGLEVGDVLEYFSHNEQSLEFFSLSPISVFFTGRYPVMNLEIRCAFDKQLTVEYVTINGAPDFTTKDESGNRNQLAISLHGLPALKTDRYTNRMRQLPMVKIRTMNNTVKGLYRPKTSRGGCMYGNMGVDCYLTDIGSALMDQRYDAGNSIYGKAMGTLKSFRKSRPEAGRRELIDAAWLSLMYHNYISALNDEGSESPMMQSVMFKDMVEKSGLGNDDVSIAVINPRTDVAIQYISHWKEPDCAAVVGDSLYVFTSFGTYLPGELPERLQGEMGACFEGSRENYTQLSKLKYIETKTTFARHNKHESEMTASFADDGFEALNVNRKVKATGLYKGYLGLPQSLSGFMNSVGSYLGVKNVKVPKKFDLDEVEMKKQLDEALGDEAESFLGVRPKAIDGVDIESFGNIPGSPTAIFSARYTLENMAQDMGDDVIVGVGKLFGDNVKVEGEERERELPAFMKLPNQVSRKLVLIVPEGYAADEESVALLNKNVTNSIGNFYTTARVNDEGNVELQCAERYNTFYVQPQLWAQYLEVSDAAADFNEAELVLHKKM